MLGEGMRYASTRNVRKNRNRRTAPRMPLMFSQSVPERLPPVLPSRMAATLPFPWAGTAAGVFAFFFLVAIVRRAVGSGCGGTACNYARGTLQLQGQDQSPGRNKARPDWTRLGKQGGE